MNAHARKVLEFDAVLAQVAGHCQSSLAAAWTHELEPSFDRAEVALLLAQTDAALDLLDTVSLPSLAPIADLSWALNRAKRGGELDGETIFAIGEAMSAVRQLAQALPKVAPTAIEDEVRLLIIEQKLEQRILDSVDASGEVLESASPELGRLRRAKKSSQAKLMGRLQSYTTGRDRAYLSDPIYTQREGRYVIPVKAEHRGKIRGLVHDTSSSGQTIFVEPEDVLQLGNAIRENEAKERAEIARILKRLADMIGEVADPLNEAILAAARLDTILARARYGRAVSGCLPTLMSDPMIRIQNGRHPLLNVDKVVPLSLMFGGEYAGLLITGPNTGGKTVAIKTVGLFVLMGQCGIMVPAMGCELGPFMQVWADIGDEQSLQQSLSTFSGHIKNIAAALDGLQDGGLVLLDEVGAGTDPAEGSALAKAILLSIQDAGAFVMASTHYGELKIFAMNTPGFMNASMEFDLKTLSPTYRLMVGTPGASRALQIAERCGMPKAVVRRAQEGMGTTDQEVGAMLERLESAEKRARKAQSEADRLASSLRRVEEETSAKLKEAQEARKNARKQAAEELDAALRELRLQAADIFESLKQKPTEANINLAREKLKAIQTAGQSRIEQIQPKEDPAPPAKIEKGSRVKVKGTSHAGIVLDEARNGKVTVQVGVMRMTYSVNQLVLDAGAPPVVAKKARPNLGLQKAMSIRPEIHLRALRAEDAELELQKFLDDAVLAGYPSVRIVHGKGEGILRSVTQQVLKYYRNVQSYRLGEPGEGGDGVTIVDFE